MQCIPTLWTVLRCLCVNLTFSTMKKLYILMLLCTVLPLCAVAESAHDVDSLGNIWIVTIDNSGSMLNTNIVAHQNTNQTPHSLASLVYDRMRKDRRLFSKMNFEKDRFVFYTSGYSYNKGRGLSNELAKAESLDKSFIHHTDAKLHRFSNYRSLLSHIYKLMISLRYNHDLSFVSQIRTFSVVKTVNLLDELGVKDEFNTLRLLTITDDADQNDQWLVDNKHFTAADRVAVGTPISKRIKDTLQRYVCNDLTGIGAGRFEPLYAQDSSLPHIWEYEYTTIASRRDTLHESIVGVNAVEGNVVRVKVRERTVQGDPVCFYVIDSIVVNGISTIVNRKFTDELSVRVPEYRNGLRYNQVKIYGQIQLRYTDEIYGPHYRKLHFVQMEKCPAGALWTGYMFLIFLVASGVAVYVLYRLVILPRRKLMTIYGGDQSVVSVRRGYKMDWKNQLTTVADYSVSGQKIERVLARKCHNVGKTEDGYDTQRPDVLVCSGARLRFSEECLRRTSFEDLESEYSTHSGDYPELLQEVYGCSLVAKLRVLYFDVSSVFLAKLIRNMITFINWISPIYYYYFDDITKYNAIIIDSPDMLSGRKMVIDVSCCKRDSETSAVERILTSYYADDRVTDLDALVCCEIVEDNEFWRIILLNDHAEVQASILNPKLIYRYVKASDETNREIYQKALLAYAKRKLKGHKVGVYNCECQKMTEVLSFNVEVCPIPGFISFMEYKEKPKNQLLYSPFEDGNIRSKYISLDADMADGHLYQSFLPYRVLRKIFNGAPVCESALKRLSEEIVRIESCSAGRMSVDPNKVSYKGVNVEFNN